MIRAQRWDNIQVQEERNLLLRADNELALQLAKEIREQLIQSFVNTFSYVRINKEQAYRDRSYFRNKNQPCPKAERDESSLSSKELSSMLLVDDKDIGKVKEGDSEFED